MISNEALEGLLWFFRGIEGPSSDIVLALEELRELRKSRQFPVEIVNE